MPSVKRIHRAPHDKENPYYLGARVTSQNKAISYDALGMLHYILSKPDDWDIQPEDLQREKCGGNKVYVVLKELIRSQYVERIYHRDENMRIVLVEYIAHEIALSNEPLSEKPKVAKPKVENQYSNTVYRKKQSTEVTKERVARGRKAAPKKTPKGTRSTPALIELHPLIALWATYRGIDAVNIGAPIFSTKDLAAARRMSKWTEPPLAEEVKAAIHASKVKAYPFMWLEADIPRRRLDTAQKPAPSATATKAAQDKRMHDYEEMFGKQHAK